MRRLNLILLVMAGLLLALLLAGMEWRAFWLQLRNNLPYAPLLLIPYGAVCYLWTCSWQLLFTERATAPPLYRLFFIRLAGEALNQLTPSASLGGEPYKAYRLHQLGVSWEQAAASLVIQKVVMVVSLVLYILLCLALIPVLVPGLPPRVILASSLGAILLGAGALGFFLVQRQNPCALLLRFLRRIGLCPGWLLAREEQLNRVDRELSGFYREHPVQAYLSLGCYFLGWVLHAVEVWTIFRFMGYPLGWGLSLCLDALAQLFAGLGFMIPASLGVQEGGNILLSLGFKLGLTLGAGFSLLRRFREAFWLCLGLVVVARESRRA